MADRVTLRKQGWTADYISPLTGKRRQVVVESEDAGWALIQQEGQAAATAEDKAQRTGIRQAPAAPMGGFSLQQAWELSWERRFKGQASARSVQTNYARIAKFFGIRTQLAAISNIWFNEWRQSMLAEGLKNSGINRITSTLQSMRADALLFGRVTELPQLPKTLRETRIPPRFLSQEEVNLLVSFFRANNDQQMEDMFLFRVSEGCRFEETQRLTPRDFDFPADQVTFWKTKNGSPRTVPLVGVAREIGKRRCEGKGADEPIFTYSYVQWNRRFTEAKRTLRLPGRVVGHTTRHTMAARAVSANVSTQLLKHWGGWKSTAALEHYAHLDTQGLKHMQKALESFE
jgi:integrase